MRQALAIAALVLGVLVALPGLLAVLLLVLVLVPPDGALMLAALGALLGAEVHSCLARWVSATGRENSQPAGAVKTMSGSICGALALPVLAGAIAFLGLGILVAMVAMVGVIAVGGAVLVRHFVAATRTSVSPGADVAGWSDDSLGLAWQASYARLQRSGGPGLLSISVERGRYLDELERRDPAEFGVWLTSGAADPNDLSDWRSRTGRRR